MAKGILSGCPSTWGGRQGGLGLLIKLPDLGRTLCCIPGELLRLREAATSLSQRLCFPLVPLTAPEPLNGARPGKLYLSNPPPSKGIRVPRKS